MELFPWSASCRCRYLNILIDWAIDGVLKVAAGVVKMLVSYQ